MSYIDHLKGLSKEELESEIETKISENQNSLMDEDVVSSEIASSNADGWGVDEAIIGKPDLTKADKVLVPIEFSLSGDQKDDSPFCGTAIRGSAVAVFDSKGDVYFTKVEAERDLGNEEEEEE